MNSYNQFKQNIINIFSYIVDSFNSTVDIQILFDYSKLEEFKKDKLFKDTIEAFKLYTQELKLTEQVTYMTLYSRVLNERLQDLKK